MMYNSQEEKDHATQQVRDLREFASDDNQLAFMLGVAKNTMYSRLRDSKWKKAEIYYINFLHKKFIKS